MQDNKDKTPVALRQSAATVPPAPVEQCPGDETGGGAFAGFVGRGGACGHKSGRRLLGFMVVLRNGEPASGLPEGRIARFLFPCFLFPAFYSQAFY